VPDAQQQQQQGTAYSAVPVPLGGSALDVALLAQQAQGVSAGVGGVGVLSDEWRRAARAMAGGTSLEVRHTSLMRHNSLMCNSTHKQ
jgi:hypothetical protein